MFDLTSTRQSQTVLLIRIIQQKMEIMHPINDVLMDCSLTYSNTVINSTTVLESLDNLEIPKAIPLRMRLSRKTDKTKLKEMKMPNVTELKLETAFKVKAKKEQVPVIAFRRARSFTVKDQKKEILKLSGYNTELRTAVIPRKTDRCRIDCHKLKSLSSKTIKTTVI